MSASKIPGRKSLGHRLSKAVEMLSCLKITSINDNAATPMSEETLFEQRTLGHAGEQFCKPCDFPRLSCPLWSPNDRFINILHPGDLGHWAWSCFNLSLGCSLWTQQRDRPRPPGLAKLLSRSPTSNKKEVVTNGKEAALFTFCVTVCWFLTARPGMIANLGPSSK